MPKKMLPHCFIVFISLLIAGCGAVSMPDTAKPRLADLNVALNIARESTQEPEVISPEILKFAPKSFFETDAKNKVISVDVAKIVRDSNGQIYGLDKDGSIKLGYFPGKEKYNIMYPINWTVK